MPCVGYLPAIAVSLPACGEEGISAPEFTGYTPLTYIDELPQLKEGARW